MKEVKAKSADSVFKSEPGRMLIQDYYKKLLSLWPVYMKSSFIETSAGRTHVMQGGRTGAPKLLLIHGASGNSAAWSADIEKLAGSFSIIAADMPGEPGLSEDARMSPSGDDYSEWIAELLDKLGIEKTVLVGMSLGGCAAMRFASVYPDRVVSLSLICPSGLAPARLSYLFKALPLMMLGRRGADRNYRLISYGGSLPEEVYEFGRLVSKYYKPLLEPIPVMNDEELQKLLMPVQYFGGDHDVILNTEASAARLGGLISQAEINVLKETGHVITGVTDRILKFAVKACAAV